MSQTNEFAASSLIVRQAAKGWENTPAAAMAAGDSA